MNYCDHGHPTYGDVRVLPLGSNSNLHVCKHHYHTELQFRKDNGNWSNEYFPAWETLKLYRDK